MCLHLYLLLQQQMMMVMMHTCLLTGTCNRGCDVAVKEQGCWHL
jgi:hypothetical protein